MPTDLDHYEIYYADKLWNLLPAIYRTVDSDQFNSNGPLRELVNRIGAQAAIVRRSMDRLWEDQSIETCDDWVVSYIGDLLATNLVASQNARGQRLDVSKTIYYRRRKGTVALLEELAADITGWDARVVEFFRRLGRTRHNFDPEIFDPGANPADDHTLELAEGFAGLWTDTHIGGWADLRNAYGASLAQSPFGVVSAARAPLAFDEFFHTADFRAGRGRSGWYKIPNLGVFLWRLTSFGLAQTTPVQNGNCFTFDPTGREIPLFVASSRPLGDGWVSPQEWQLPSPITAPLLRAALANPLGQPLYAELAPDGFTVEPNSLGLFTKGGSFYDLMDVSQMTTFPENPAAAHQVMLFPETGRFGLLHPPMKAPVTVTYHYGFSAPMGAGPYDRRVIGGTPNPTPAPQANILGGGNAFAAGGIVGASGTASLNDSLTYTSAPDFPGIQQVTVMAQNQTRSVIRFAPPRSGVKEWVFTGNPESSLVLEGLFVNGGDIVLRGHFASVTLTCCTFDPGNSPAPTPGSAPPPGVFAQSIDGRDLTPTRLWIEAEIQNFCADRCLLGPVRTRGAGAVENLAITNSIVQAIPTSNSPLLVAGDLKDAAGLAVELKGGHDALSTFLWSQLSPATQAAANITATLAVSTALTSGLVADLNAIIAGPSLYDPARFDLAELPPETQALIAASPTGTDLQRLNRLLLEAAFPIALADLTLAFDNGVAELCRCTLLGPAYVHCLEASECILDDLVIAENTQAGCIRFTAWAAGSVIPRKYESVSIPPGAALFTSRAFGNPGYAQLLETADHAILPAPQDAATKTACAGGSTPAQTISAGAQNGSEMGAFASQANAIKERSLLIKYQEYAPLGMNPVIIHVT
jgi:hypothetical protein